MSRLRTIVLMCVCITALSMLLGTQAWGGDTGQQDAGEAASGERSDGKGKTTDDTVRAVCCEADVLTTVIDAHEAEEAIRRSLDKKVTVEFQNEPLEKAVQRLGEMGEFNLVVDEVGLTDEGIPIDAPVSGRFRDVPIRFALRTLLRPLGLSWTIEHEALLVTTRIVELESLRVGVYPVQPLLDLGYDISTVMAFVVASSTDRWMAFGEGVGGDITPFRGTLVVLQSESVHIEIRRLLKALAAAADTKHAQSRAFLVMSAADQRLLPALNHRVTVEFNKTPLSDVVAHLKKLTGAAIHVDEDTMRELRILPDEPVTLHVRNVTLHSALSLMLQPLGCTFVVRDGVLVVTTESDAQQEETVLTGVYVVQDLLEDNDNYSLIQLVVDSTSGPWEESGASLGMGVRSMPGLMIVRRELRLQLEVAMVLHELREKTLSSQTEADE
jgi:hypothetical protein